MGSEHTAKAFDSDLQELTRLVAEMGGLAERMIVESVDALIRRDVVLGMQALKRVAQPDDIGGVTFRQWEPPSAVTSKASRAPAIPLAAGPVAHPRKEVNIFIVTPVRDEPICTGPAVTVVPGV